MTDNVVNLRGVGFGKAAEPGRAPNETLIRELERLLELAKSGELVGMAGAYAHRDHVGYSYAGAVGGFAMIGGLDCVRERLLRTAVYGDV